MAQILKSEIREKILKNALDDFLANGFQNTSMKSIAQKSEIAVGNIYNYFKDKEALYDTLVQPVFQDINYLFEQVPKNFTLNKIEEKILRFIEIYKSNREVFIMLLSNSNNTKFETLKETLILNFAAAIIRFKNSSVLSSAKSADDIFIKSFACAYINGIINILSENTSEDRKLKVLYEFLSFMRDSLVGKLKNITGE